MLIDRGYKGSVIQVRRRIRRDGLRPAPKVEAFLELSTMPAEEAQCDWMHVGTMRVGSVERPVYALVISLSWSRAFHAYFSFDQKVESVMRGHLAAFEFFGGVPRRILYDNMKTAVVERRGDAIRYNDRLLELAGHYLFEPIACRVRRPTDKARVERRIRDIRESFVYPHELQTMGILRQAFDDWRRQTPMMRKCPEDASLTVGEALEYERGFLLALPDNNLHCDEVRHTVTRRKRLPPRAARQQPALRRGTSHRHTSKAVGQLRH